MIKLTNVSKYYASDNAVALGLRKVNIEFKIGEFVAITGESGSGKSTLLNVISGIDTYEEGEMYIDGEETSYFDDNDWENYRSHSVGFIFQNYNLIDSYNVLENVEVPMIIQGIDAKERRKRALEIIHEVGLDSHIHHKATKLSGGQKQRLAIARAISKNTKIIVADEPTGNLDSKTGKEILELLNKISKNRLVLIVTHNYEEAEPYVTRKVRLFDGEIVEDRQVNKIEKAPETEFSNIEYKENTFKKAINFSLLNLKSQPKKTTLLGFATFISLISIFVFYVSFQLTSAIGNISFSYTAYNMYEERVIAKKINSGEITIEEMKELEEIRGVNFINKYDYALDSILNGEVSFGESLWQGFYIDNYLRDARTLKKEDLTLGRMPENKNEIVLEIGSNFFENYLEDLENYTIGRNCSFSIETSASYNRNVIFEGLNLKVVGLISSNNYTGYAYCQEENLKEINDLMSVYYENTTALSYKASVTPEIITDEGRFLILDESLPSNTIGFSEYDKLNALKNSNLEIYIRGEKVNYFNFSYEDKYVNENTILISEDIFSSLTPASYDQISIDLTDQSYANGVISRLYTKGYYAYSPSLIANNDFDISIFITFMAMLGFIWNLLVIFLVAYFVIRTIMLSRKRDYAILKTLGIDTKTIKLTGLFEILFTYLGSYILLVLLVIIFSFSGNQYVREVLNQIKFSEYLILFVITVLFSLMVSSSYNKYLIKKSIITDLKVE